MSGRVARQPIFLPVAFLWAFGTIGPMSDHRVRLTDEDIELIVAALRARSAMARGLRAHRLWRLAERLSEGGRGNPKWRIDEASQTHEEDLDTEDS